ncbi:MAG: single-stranded-DNA-specific exonuclease RecJ [Cyanophyceae cyanobacterium]
MGLAGAGQIEAIAEFGAIAAAVLGRPVPALARLLWGRSWRSRWGPSGLTGGDRAALEAFLVPTAVVPAGPEAFGEEMNWAVERLTIARDRGERLAIWGDFDADGVTATAVLWEGLGAWFDRPSGQLRYVIPNRLRESHGLTGAGLEDLAAAGVSVVVTCDTGCTSLPELERARELGLAVIVTDHHALLPVRPPVVALINPRSLPADHSAATLSGVAVAYLLILALHRAWGPPEGSGGTGDGARSPEDLLDLVAIGLIADLVELRGDARHWAAVGLERLQKTERPGVRSLLDACKRTGDRPADVSFGLGPRINAVSRVYGDASFCVELLTGTDPARCRQLAHRAELANTRRKGLQKQVADQVRSRLGRLDLSTTPIVVLAEVGWPVGVLGLVAGEVAREFNRPTILLSVEGDWARGSARSVTGIDFYELLAAEGRWLTRFGGHPQAAGLMLPAADVGEFAIAIARRFRERFGEGDPAGTPLLTADLTVTVADLTPDLFRELKAIEPCGMGNPAPRLRIDDCWFEGAYHRNLRDRGGQQIRYICTLFQLRDGSVDGGDRGAVPGRWWGHYAHELPSGRCSVIGEFDFRSVDGQGVYEFRLLAIVPPGEEPRPVAGLTVLDWRRDRDDTAPDPAAPEPLILDRCPQGWDELIAVARRARNGGHPLALAYGCAPPPDAIATWCELVGIAKYLARTGQPIPRSRLSERLALGDRPMALMTAALAAAGFQGDYLDPAPGDPPTNPRLRIRALAPKPLPPEPPPAIAQFLDAVAETRFRQRYFMQAPLTTVAQGINRAIAIQRPSPQRTSQ